MVIAKIIGWARGKNATLLLVGIFCGTRPLQYHILTHVLSTLVHGCAAFSIGLSGCS